MDKSEASYSQTSALFWRQTEKGILCELCPHSCFVSEGGRGICGARANAGGLKAESYGIVTSISLDPIEKKPLYMFSPGSAVLSVGSFGCNFRCPFCQNYEIACARPSGHIQMNKITPEGLLELAQKAVPQGNIGIAYTYNEPLVGYEFVYDCARLVKAARLCNVLVTNGFINSGPLETLLPYIDAMNIDLKAFSGEFYENIGGGFEQVKNVIRQAAANCHVEITTLVIPGENENDIAELAEWLAEINPAMPLHLSRFFPRHKYANRRPTPRETMLRLAETAGKHLTNVFLGNM